MAQRKAITLIVGNNLFVDPSDAHRVNIDAIRKKTNNHKLQLCVAPISSFMPASGTKALMDAAIKNMNARAK